MLSGFGLVLAVLGSAGHFLFDWTPAALLAFAGAAGYVALQAPHLPRTGKVILGIAIIASVAAWPWLDDPSSAFLKAARLSGFYAALFAAGAFLREAAERSAMIRRSGQHIIEQPGSRRYLAVNLGANILGLIMSFGSAQLLGAMIRGGRKAAVTAPEREALIAVHRGFGTSPSWSPISVGLAIGLTYAPGASVTTVLTVATITVLAITGLGWLLQRGGAAGGETTTDESWSVHMPLLALLSAILAILVVGVQLFDIRLIQAVILLLPPIAMVWLAVQNRSRDPILGLRRTGRACRHMIADSFPSYRMEVTILASAGLAGNLVASALPTETIAAWVAASPLPGALMPALIVAFMALGGQLALNPIITATLIGAIMPGPAAVGAEPSMVALAYMVGWTACVSSSPYSLTTLIVAGIADVDGRTVAFRWSGLFNLCLMVFVALWLSGLSAWLISL